MLKMENPGLTLETADALAVAGLSRKQWDNLMQRQLYPVAPPVKAGHPRHFTRDDVVALFVLDYYNRLGLQPSLSARVAAAFKIEMQKGGNALERLWVVATDNGRPVRVVPRKPADMMAHEFPVAEMRRNIEGLIAKKKKASA